jgi:restriction system protein
MSAWLVRGGRAGEREGWALETGVSGGGFREVGDLSNCATKEDVQAAVHVAYPDRPLQSIRNFAAQLWILRDRIKTGDLVVMPLKTTKQIAIGKCISGYKFLDNTDSERRHTIGVEWIRTDVPRNTLKQDLLFSLGAFMTVCKTDRSARNGSRPTRGTAGSTGTDDTYTTVTRVRNQHIQPTLIEGRAS